MANTTPTWQADPHTIAKHKILKSYIGAWHVILIQYLLSAGKRCHSSLYIDGFSGPGIYNNGEPGSPIIAMDEAAKLVDRYPNWNFEFLFIEEDYDRIKMLESIIATKQYPDALKYTLVYGEFQEKFPNAFYNYRPSIQVVKPTFVFLDPFGYSGIPFRLVENILTNQMTEVLITFMVRDINRFISDPSKQNTFVDLFGTNEVLDSTIRYNITELVELYKRRLLLKSPFVHSFQMCDENDKVIYHLIHASKSSKAFVEMKKAMWKQDPTGDFRFSDGQNPNQPEMFPPEHDRLLLKMLQEKYNDNMTIDTANIRRWVEESTIYLDSHMKQSLRLAESQSLIEIEPLKTDQNKRRKDTFPDGVLLRFIL